jgi:hypothetical protein
MRRILAAASALVLLALTLGGCKNGETVSPGEAAQDLSGFSLEGSASGGGTVRNANLSLVEMKDENGDTVITLDFVSDSTLSGEGTQRDVVNPPKYKIYTLGKPCRLVIEFESLAYWDYERAFARAGRRVPALHAALARVGLQGERGGQRRHGDAAPHPQSRVHAAGDRDGRRGGYFRG